MGQTGGPVTPKEAWARRVVALVRTRARLRGCGMQSLGTATSQGQGQGSSLVPWRRTVVLAAQEAVPTEEALGTTPPQGAETGGTGLGSISGRWSKPSGSPSLHRSSAPSSVAQLPKPLGTECANCAWRPKHGQVQGRAREAHPCLAVADPCPRSPCRPRLGLHQQGRAGV